MGKDRNIVDVIERIVVEVPEDLEWNTLRARLLALKETAMFTAPEFMTMRWRMLCDILTDGMPSSPVETWQIKIGRIVRAEE